MAFLVATTSLPEVYRVNNEARTTTAGTPHARANLIIMRYAWSIIEIFLLMTPELYLRFAWYMPEICLRFTWGMLDICVTIIGDIPDGCLRYVKDWHVISLWYAWDLPEIWMKYT